MGFSFTAEELNSIEIKLTSSAQSALYMCSKKLNLNTLYTKDEILQTLDTRANCFNELKRKGYLKKTSMGYYFSL